jgi:hypothetical protein
MKFRKVASLCELNRTRLTSVLPSILTFQRRAIRRLPDGKEIGEYYSDQTKTTIIYPNTFIEKEHK